MSGEYAKGVGKWHQPGVRELPARTPCRWCLDKLGVAKSYAGEFCPECAANGWTLSHLTLWRKVIRDGVRIRLVPEASGVWLRQLSPAQCELNALPKREKFVGEMRKFWRG